MSRDIKFRAEYEGKIYNVETKIPKRKDHKGFYKENGYIMRLVTEHPHSNCRGYVAEHRLIMEQLLQRFLIPRKELIHHIDENRENNDIENLKLTTPSEHFYEEHFKARNNNGTFVCEQPIFEEIKYRLYDKDKNIVQIYTLKELMSKTFRRAKFEFRGRYTGLKDKNDKEIYEGDIITIINNSIDEEDGYFIVKYDVETARYILSGNSLLYDFDNTYANECEILGDIYENPNLLKEGL